MPLCLTFIDLKKAFDSVETEAVVEALDNQGIPTQYIKVLRELYSNFTTRISPFYKNIIINVSRGVRQVDKISPKIFTATLENAIPAANPTSRLKAAQRWPWPSGSYGGETSSRQVQPCHKGVRLVARSLGQGYRLAK
ncbi:hypothetical protein RB195_023303 [Necator americanus]|uniref:Reverse transcriptase domain-containing protein n=1 Tax=Necator americanus TaxID=51031 RepID=A0ABR1EIL1_NECAM